MLVLELVGFGLVGFELVDFELGGFVLAGLVMGFFFKGRGELLAGEEAWVLAVEEALVWAEEFLAGLLAGEEAFFASLLSFPRKRESLRVSAFLSFFVMFYLPLRASRNGTHFLDSQPLYQLLFKMSTLRGLGITMGNGRINKKSSKRAFFDSLNLKKDLQVDIQGLRQDIRTIQHALMKRKPAGYTNEK